MKNISWNWKTLDEVANCEKSKKGKNYKAGSVLIPLSACIGSPLIQLTEPGTAEEKFYVAEPSDKILSNYLFLAISEEWERFKTAYIQNINIRVEDIRHYRIKYCSIEDQEKVMNRLNAIDGDIKREMEMMEKWKAVKKYLMYYMFP